MLDRENSVLWITPEAKGGIRSYVGELLPFFGRLVRASFTLEAPESLAGMDADLIHVQHEYGLFGSKIPGRYSFPNWFKRAKAATPGKKWVATAHSVLGPDYRFPYAETGWQRLPRFLMNTVLALPFNPLAKLWGMQTWGKFDGVIVLHRQQIDPVRAAGCARVKVIPLPVAKIENLPEVASNRRTKVILFGYFATGKGQDIAVRAWKILGDEAPPLVLAGGVRRPEDQPYYDSCVKLIRDLGLAEKIEVSGYVPNEKLAGFYSEAKLVLARFALPRDRLRSRRHSLTECPFSLPISF
jgi:glycosyltransferase involved in cell wall biosynthesis